MSRLVCISLRHTFCSHLAMRGAPARAIQELAGHSELGVTQRYMHLSPAALDAPFSCSTAVATCWQRVQGKRQMGENARRIAEKLAGRQGFEPR